MSQGLATSGDLISTVSVNAAGAFATLALAGRQGVAISFAGGGTLIATVLFQASYNGGTTYDVTPSSRVSVPNLLATSVVRASGDPAVAYSVQLGAGATHVRVFVSLFTSGAETVFISATSIAQLSTPPGVVFAAAVAPNFLTLVGGVNAGISRIFLTDAAGNITTNPTGFVTPVGGFDGTFTRQLLVDASGRQIVIGAAAGGAAVVGNPVLVAGSDGTNVQTLGTFLNRSVPTSLVTPAHAGLDSESVIRIQRASKDASLRTTSEILLWHDALESSTVNTFWTQSTTTMTIAQAIGVLTLNNANITTLNTDAIVTSQRQYPKYPRQPISVRFRANITANVAANHTLVELGLGAPVGITAVVNNGAFFRWRVDGTLAAVTSYNGTENVSQVLAQGLIVTANYYDYEVILDDDFARFIVVDANGTPLVDKTLRIPVATATILAVSHIPSFARVYVDATGGGTAIKLLISAHTVQMLDAVITKSWGEQLAASMRQADINPTSYVQTPQLANAAAPATTTPSNTASAYATLGGSYVSAATAAGEGLLSIFGFQIPSPYTFYLRSIFIPPPVVEGVVIVTAAVLEWFLAFNASSNNLSTATGTIRQPLPAMHTAAAAAAVASIFNGGPMSWIPRTPVVCLPGTFLHVGYKSINGAATASLLYRGNVVIDGYFE